MSELDVRSELVAADHEQVLSELAGRQEHVLANLAELKQILDRSQSPSGGIYVETLSQALDIRGFFMDEASSDLRVEKYMLLGHINRGDALTGKNARLVTRNVEGKKIQQIEVDFGTEDEAVVGYFNLEDTLHGCSIRSW